MIIQRVPLIVLIFATLLVPPVAADGHGDLDALGWLAGCWQGEGGGGRNQECWTAPEGGVMLAVSRVISERGTSFEFLRIARHDDGLAYFASPGGEPAVAFKLVESAGGLAVFANPEHDFPQRITYRRDGDTMTARVEAERDGEWSGFEVAWRRAPAGWTETSGPQEADLAQQVRDAETAFAQTMADRDHEAFSDFLAEDAIFVSRATARGRDAVADQWGRYFEGPEAPFSWQPETVEVLESGTLALSTGPVRDPAGNLFSRFSSIWRREASGEWRVVFDQGEPVCAPPPGAAPARE